MGRPRGFCPEAALDRALEVFWRKGYEGASLSDLTKAMGINRPSLYCAFGNKETLFRKALDRYVGHKETVLREAMAAPTAREAMERLMRAAAEALTDPNHPTGCLAVQGALTSGAGADSVREELARRRLDQETLLRDRLEQAEREGDLPPGCEPDGLAKFFSALLHGMAVQAASGATREALLQVGAGALRLWPEPSSSDEPATKTPEAATTL